MNTSNTLSTQILHWLKQLSANPSQLEAVRQQYPVPLAYQRTQVTPTQLATDVVRYAESRDELTVLHDAIRRVAPTLTNTIPDVVINPYRGLATFQAADKDCFFGRQREIDALLTLVTQQRLLALVGERGSGKSSVVLAGLIPRLGDNWQVVQCRPETNPFNRLALGLVRLLYDDKLEQVVQLEKLEQGLQAGRVNLAALVQVWADSVTQDSPRLLVVIDQFEALYTSSDKATQQRFLDCLLRLLDSDVPVVVLLTLRADFVNHAQAYPAFAAALNQHTRVISTMNRDELCDVIEKPAALAGLQLETGLSAQILDDVGLAAARLPLLQFALAQLFEQHTDGELRLQDYLQLGGVEQALTNYAEAQFHTFPATQHATLRHIFVQLVHPGLGTGDTRRVATYAQLQAQWDVVQKLVVQRLVLIEYDAESGQDTVTIVHDALLQNWARLRGWVAEDRAFRVWQDELRADMAYWEKNGRQQADLQQEDKLSTSLAMRAKHGQALNQQEVEFIALGEGAQQRQQ